MKSLLSRQAFLALLLTGLLLGSLRGECDCEKDWERFGFPVGEELVYRVYWGFIPVGLAKIVTRWITDENGKRLIAIRYRAKSNRILSTVYPVNDQIETRVDPDGFLPTCFVKNLREGKSRHHELITFDYAHTNAHWISLRKNKERDFNITTNTRDLVSFMYSMRKDPFKPGDEKTFTVMADGKLYDLFVRATKSEKIKLKAFGKVRCIRLDPKAKFNGLFIRKGKLTVWVSQDRRGIVTRAEAEVPFANVHIVLSEVHGPGDDFWIRRTQKNIRKGKVKVDPEVEKAIRELDENPNGLCPEIIRKRPEPEEETAPPAPETAEHDNPSTPSEPAAAKDKAP